MYQICKFGLIRSLLISRGRRKRILQPVKNDLGYDFITLYDGKNHKRIRIHKLVALHFIPNPENKPFINHKNGIKLDNFYKNLEWCTCSENHKHAYKTGLKKASPSKGEKHGMHILTELQVNEIRKRYKNGEYYRDLALIYNVSHYCIWDIIKNRSWKQ